MLVVLRAVCAGPNTITNMQYSNIPSEADRLGISQRLLWRWIKARRVPSIKCGRRVLLRPEEVDAALNRFRAAAIGEGNQK
jgi:excisionase family DNA binding protein